MKANDYLIPNSTQVNALAFYGGSIYDRWPIVAWRLCEGEDTPLAITPDAETNRAIAKGDTVSAVVCLEYDLRGKTYYVFSDDTQADSFTEAQEVATRLRQRQRK